MLPPSRSRFGRREQGISCWLPCRSGWDCRKRLWVCGVDASRMTEAACAITVAAVWVWGDVENDVVRMRGIARDSANSRQRLGSSQVIQTEEISHAPSDVVVRAGRVATHTYSANEMMTLRVEAQPAAKNVHATNFESVHGVRSGAVV